MLINFKVNYFKAYNRLKIINFIFKIIFIYICFLSSVNAAEEQIKEELKNNFLSNEFAINTIESYKKGGVLFRRVIAIQPVEFKPNTSLESTQRIAFPKLPDFKKPIWVITPEQLPVTEDMCLEKESVTCDEGKNDLYSGGCYQPCLTYGPQFLAYDEKNGKIYLTVEATGYGTGGGTNFTFLADVNTKEIKHLDTEGGPITGVISPSGKYLLTISLARIKIYNTQTKEKFYITEHNLFGPPITKIHYFTHIKWLNDNQFTYEDNVIHDKFQDDEDGITEYTYDISAQKKISKHVIKPNTYKYSAKDDEE